MDSNSQEAAKKVVEKIESMLPPQGTLNVMFQVEGSPVPATPATLD